MSSRISRKRRAAFTLVELLVVIGIIALLVSILLPALGAARRQAATIKCAAQMRDMGTYYRFYEIEYKGYWPVARINGWQPNGTAAIAKYNIDGTDYPTAVPAAGQAYWFTFLAKYATKSRAGNAAGVDVQAALDWRKSIFMGCPAWDGYKQGGINVTDTNIVQVGYGMNPYPSFGPSYPTGAGAPAQPANAVNMEKEYAVHSTGDTYRGNFLKAKAWTRSSERLLLADSKFWLASAEYVAPRASYYSCVNPQPIIANSSTFLATAVAHQFDAGTTVVDIYRHGKYPSIAGYLFSPVGGKIAYNILYADGHVATSSEGVDAYKSIRMKFPG